MKCLTAAQLDELRQFDTPTICNAIEAFAVRKDSEGYLFPGMLLRTRDNTPMVGYAVTAKVSATFPKEDSRATLMGYYGQVRACEGPSIAVIQDIDERPVGSFWGEVQATVHQSLGCIGTLTQGGVRDLNEVDELGFSFFSTDLVVGHGFIHVESFGLPVRILGLEIFPGDLLHCDRHGVVKIPHEVAPRLAAACRAIAAAELPMLEPCRAAIAAGRRPTIDELADWQSQMVAARQACKQ